MMDKTWGEEKRFLSLLVSNGTLQTTPFVLLSVYLDCMFKCFHLLVVDDILQVCTLYHDHLDTQKHKGRCLKREKSPSRATPQANLVTVKSTLQLPGTCNVRNVIKPEKWMTRLSTSQIVLFPVYFPNRTLISPVTSMEWRRVSIWKMLHPLLATNSGVKTMIKRLLCSTLRAKSSMYAGRERHGDKIKVKSKKRVGEGCHLEWSEDQTMVGVLQFTIIYYNFIFRNTYKIKKKQFQQESMESEVLVIVSNAVSFSFVIINYIRFKTKLYGTEY